MGEQRKRVFCKNRYIIQEEILLGERKKFICFTKKREKLRKQNQ